MNKLIMLCGIPGSGKSTWANAQNCKVVSRDKIRFSMLNEGDAYFSKEKEVFKEFVAEISSELKCGNDVIADATHLNYGSRTKLLRALGADLKDTKVIAIVMNTAVEQALINNENRRGTLSYVPPEVIKSMEQKFSYPELEEGFDEIHLMKRGEL